MKIRNEIKICDVNNYEIKKYEFVKNILHIYIYIFISLNHFFLFYLLNSFYLFIFFKYLIF